MFCVCAGNSVDNSGMFSLLLNSACTGSRLLTPLHQQGVWGWTRICEGIHLGQLTPSDQRDIPDHIASCSAYKTGKEGWREDVQSKVVFFPKTPLSVMEPCFSGDGWTPASPWEAVNAHLVLLCLYAQLLLYLLNFISTHEFSHLYPFSSLPHPTSVESVSSCVGLSCLVG